MGLYFYTSYKKEEEAHLTFYRSFREMFSVTKGLIRNLSLFQVRLPPLVVAAMAPSSVVRVYSTATSPSPSEVSVKKVGTHNGSFHCDEALGCFMIRLADKFSGADIVRSRDPKVTQSILHGFMCF